MKNMVMILSYQTSEGVTSALWLLFRMHILLWPFTWWLSRMDTGSGNIWQGFVLIAKASAVSCLGFIWTAISQDC